MSRSFWMRDAHADEAPESGGNVALGGHSATVVVGGGLSGVSLCHHLAALRGGVATCLGDVVLLEARTICSGATGRNGGHLWPTPFPPSLDDVATLGEEAAWRAMHFERWTTEMLIECIHSLGLTEECELVMNGSTLLTRSAVEDELFRATMARLPEHLRAMYGTERIAGEDLPARVGTRPGAFHSGYFQHLAGQLWPWRLVQALHKRNVAMGLRTFEHTRVAVVARLSPTLYRVTTQSGATIDCGRVVLATNAYTPALLPEISRFLRPVRGQVISTTPLPVGKRPLTNASFNDDFEYMISRPDGRVVLGGCRWRSGTPKRQEDIVDDSVVQAAVGVALRETLVESFNVDAADFEVEHEWTGIMGYTLDECPLVGRVPDADSAPQHESPSSSTGLFMVAGFTGHGMPQVFGATRCLAERLERDRELEQFPLQFLPSRARWSAAERGLAAAAAHDGEGHGATDAETKRWRGDVLGPQ